MNWWRAQRNRRLETGKRKRKNMIWVIEYLGTPPCWIADQKGSSAAFDVTFQRSLAKNFPCREDAMLELLRLGLSPQWAAHQIGRIANEH